MVLTTQQATPEPTYNTFVGHGSPTDFTFFGIGDEPDSEGFRACVIPGNFPGYLNVVTYDGLIGLARIRVVTPFWATHA